MVENAEAYVILRRLMNTMETILVTGGLGFVGSTFSRIAIEKGHPIRIVDNLSSGSREVADELQETDAEIIHWRYTRL